MNTELDTKGQLQPPEDDPSSDGFLIAGCYGGWAREQRIWK
jgi:hypothetical protein